MVIKSTPPPCGLGVAAESAEFRVDAPSSKTRSPQGAIDPSVTLCPRHPPLHLCTTVQVQALHTRVCRGGGAASVKASARVRNRSAGLLAPVESSAQTPPGVDLITHQTHAGSWPPWSTTGESPFWLARRLCCRGSGSC